MMAYANLQSMRIWQSFLKRCGPLEELRPIVDTSLSLLKEAILYQDAKLAGLVRRSLPGRQSGGAQDARLYLRESLDDVNSTLLLSRLLECPVYDWVDHMPYYRTKFARTLETVNEPIEVFRSLFRTFVPQFQLESVQELLDIKGDKRFRYLQQIVRQLSEDDVTQEMVSDALTDVARMQRSCSVSPRLSHG